MSGRASANLIDDFVQTLVDCRQLYLCAGRECCRQTARGRERTPHEFMQWMDDLHRGLLIKIYMDVALADRQWQAPERHLAQHLFAHLWNRHLEGDALREAAQGLHQRAQRLSLRELLQPFLKFDFLRDRCGELETVVMRLANLIAKADGQLTSAESDRLHRLQETFDRMLAEAVEDPECRRPPVAFGTQAQAVRGAAPTPAPTRSRPTADARSGPVAVPEETAERRLQEALERLDRLIGLERAKQEIRTLSNFLKVQNERRQAGLPQPPLSLHLVFVGNPGTGKTTVARIVGQIYGAMGILQNGHLVETDRSGLVAEYAGQTATKTNRLIDEALDGVLFIDEAYSLVAADSEDAFGREALQTLLKRMEDDRDRLAVILAGYPEPMERLLKSNPGLSSRFGRTLVFEDYDCMQLAQIFQRLCEQNHYVLTHEFRSRLLMGLKWLHSQRDAHFGNGRLIRNLFEDAIRQLANRIAEITPLTRELLTEFRAEDLRFDQVPAELWQRYPTTTTPFQTPCPGCQRLRALTGDMLGRRVRCPACAEVFTVDWAEPLIGDSAAG